jgi:transcriptional regulator with XRE-family HTH domain
MDSQWLKSQLTLHPHKSKAELARALGLEPPAVSKILNGTRQIKAQEYMNMRRFFELPVDGERAAMSGDLNYVLKPLQIKDGLKDADAHPAQWILPASLLNERTEAPSEKIRIFKVTDHFMEPEFRKDEHVLVDLSNITPSPPSPFIVSDGFGYMVRHCEFVPMSKPAKIRISAYNKLFVPQVLTAKEFIIVGRVMAKLQWL